MSRKIDLEEVDLTLLRHYVPNNPSTSVIIRPNRAMIASYETEILEINEAGEIILFDETKYSRTTTRVQNGIIKFFSENGVEGF